MNENCPLTGQPCNAQKIFHITDIKDGDYSSIDLCQQCAHLHFNDVEIKKPETVSAIEVRPPSVLLHCMLEFMQFVFGKERPVKLINKQCPNCGITSDDIAKNGKLGCAKCWNVFEKELAPILQYEQNATQHIGKSPQSVAAQLKFNPHEQRLRLVRTKDELESKLTKSIQAEAYEDAAMYRDQLKHISTVYEELLTLEKEMTLAVDSGDFNKAIELKNQIEKRLIESVK